MLRSFKTTASCILLALTVPYTVLANNSLPDTPVTVHAKGSPSVKADSNVEQQTQDQMAERRKQIAAEAIAAISETRNALKALDEGKKDAAFSALERSTGKLELILARDPKLSLAPTNVEAMTIKVIADINKVREARKEATRLLDSGQVQAARHLLEGLASETVISVSNIPLATYPSAIKQAGKLLDEGKQEEAKKVLQKALNTLVVTHTIIPLPVVTTQEMLKEAETLAEKANRKDDDNKRLASLLTDARNQLEFAQVLGYGTRADFKDLYAQLDDITNKTSAGKSGIGFFTKIKSILSDLVESSQPVSGGQTNAKQAITQPNKK